MMINEADMMIWLYDDDTWWLDYWEAMHEGYYYERNVMTSEIAIDMTDYDDDMIPEKEVMITKITTIDIDKR